MSEPSYRITTEHDPADEPSVQWTARIVRLSDGEKYAPIFGDSEEYVVRKAQSAIARISSDPQEGHVMFAAEDGTITHGGPTPVPDSLRVS
jgi:hypothetical protein